MANKTMVEKNAEPAARPSSPSIKLNAFVIKSTQMIVSGRATSVLRLPLRSTGPIAELRCLPHRAASRRLPVSRISRMGLFLEYRRIGPARTIIAIDPHTHAIPRAGTEKCRPHGLGTSIARSAAKTKDPQIAMPPTRGTGLLCMCRSEVGSDTQRRECAYSRTQGVRISERTKLTKKHRMYASAIIRVLCVQLALVRDLLGTEPRRDSDGEPFLDARVRATSAHSDE